MLPSRRVRHNPRNLNNPIRAPGVDNLTGFEELNFWGTLMTIGMLVYLVSWKYSILTNNVSGHLDLAIEQNDIPAVGEDAKTKPLIPEPVNAWRLVYFFNIVTIVVGSSFLLGEVRRAIRQFNFDEEAAGNNSLIYDILLGVLMLATIGESVVWACVVATTGYEIPPYVYSSFSCSGLLIFSAVNFVEDIQLRLRIGRGTERRE
ncbi:hypothetical protein Ocin01_14848 [Orchesella cincta]|uniref:Uncharacterized protein n=1 Tax=Orchesella cincta TaxID=48709 RepID=A0A1D2MG01_ORCCI|nr:hypothetical protein Ocin01_14848 [Orchesella cincta]